MQFGTPREIYEDPCSAYVAARLGQPRINLLPVGLLQDNAPAQAVTVGLRPENITLNNEQLNNGQQHGSRAATVRRIEHLGDQTRLHLSLQDHDIITLTDPQNNITSGTTIHISAHNPIFFNAQGERVT